MDNQLDYITASSEFTTKEWIINSLQERMENDIKMIDSYTKRKEENLKEVDRLNMHIQYFTELIEMWRKEIDRQNSI